VKDFLMENLKVSQNILNSFCMEKSMINTPPCHRNLPNQSYTNNTKLQTNFTFISIDASIKK